MNYSIAKSKQHARGVGVKGYNYYYNANFQKNFQNHKYENFIQKASDLKVISSKIKSAV